MATTAPAPVKEPVVTGQVTHDPGWKVLLHNDEVTPLDVVVFALQRAAGLSVEVAEAVAMEAHTEGVAIVKRGLSEEDAKVMCGGLRKWTRIPGMCPGVNCEAVPEAA